MLSEPPDQIRQGAITAVVLMSVDQQHFARRLCLEVKSVVADPSRSGNCMLTLSSVDTRPSV